MVKRNAASAFAEKTSRTLCYRVNVTMASASAKIHLSTAVYRCCSLHVASLLFPWHGNLLNSFHQRWCKHCELFFSTLRQRRRVCRHHCLLIHTLDGHIRTRTRAKLHRITKTSMNYKCPLQSEKPHNILAACSNFFNFPKRNRVIKKTKQSCRFFSNKNYYSCLLCTILPIENQCNSFI